MTEIDWWWIESCWFTSMMQFWLLPIYPWMMYIAKYNLIPNDLAIFLIPLFHVFLFTVLTDPWTVNRLEILSSVCWSGEVRPGGSFNNIYKLLNLGTLMIRAVYKGHIFQYIGKFHVEFSSVPLKFHSKYINHTLKNYISHKSGNLKSC